MAARASIQPHKALCIPENAPRIFPVRRSLVALVGKKNTVVRHDVSLRSLPVLAFDSRVQGFSTPLARRRSSYPLTSTNLVRTYPIERYQALRDGVPCLSCAATPPEGHQVGARKRRASGSTIPSQPYRRRVSTDRINCEDSQLAASSLDGESGPTPRRKDTPLLIPRNQVSEGEGTRWVAGRTRKCGHTIRGHQLLLIHNK